MTDSLLPANLSDLERELDIAISRIEQVSIPISELWNPNTCPLEALPFLAWALSVDQWRSDWSEKIKRQVVAGSLDVHRVKGTRPAIERALSDLGIDAQLVEWFEASPKAQPYTFDITAWVNDNITPDADSVLSKELYDLLFAAVVNAKNTRSGFTFKVGAKFSSNTIGVGSVIEGQAALARRDAHAFQEALESKSCISAGMAGNGVALTRHNSQPFIDASPSIMAVNIASVMSSGAVIYRRMEATT